MCSRLICYLCENDTNLRLNSFNLHCRNNFSNCFFFVLTFWGLLRKKLHANHPQSHPTLQGSHINPSPLTLTPSPTPPDNFFLLIFYTGCQRKLLINLKILILFSCVKNIILLTRYPCSSCIALTTQNKIHTYSESLLVQAHALLMH